MHRVVALWHALATSPRGVVLKRFAEQRGWDVRYVNRDRQTLEGAGFPIHGERGKYWLPADWAPRLKVDIDREELFALFLARQMAGASRETSIGRALDRLWSKLAGTSRQIPLVPEGESPVVTRLVPAIDYGPHRAHIEILERAIVAGEAVTCRYRRPRTGKLTERTIEPGELYFDPALESLYCIAWCRLRAAVRVFAVHRFLAVTATAERAPARRETRSRVALQKAFRVWRADSAERVVLHFTAAAATEVAERRWHASQQLDWTLDGGLHLTLDVADGSELERWILGFGPDVLVLEPRWLADRVRRLHQAAAKPRRAAKRARSAGGVRTPATGRSVRR
jgi:predicted DNA-binding transcriptional regulator YafY